MPGDLPEELIKDAPYLSFLPLQHIFLLILLWLELQPEPLVTSQVSACVVCYFDHILWWSLVLFPFYFPVIFITHTTSSLGAASHISLQSLEGFLLVS